MTLTANDQLNAERGTDYCGFKKMFIYNISDELEHATNATK